MTAKKSRKELEQRIIELEKEVADLVLENLFEFRQPTP